VWKTPIADASFGSWSSPSAGGDKVYMGSGETVYCFDAKDGAILWEYELTGPDDFMGETHGVVVNASVTIAEELGLCYMHTYGSFGGGTRLHAINIADGTLAWFWDTPGQGQGHVSYNPALKLVYTTSSLGGSWSNGRGTIAALDAATGDVIWYGEGSFNQFSFGGIAFDAGLNWVVAGSYDFGDYSGILVVDATTGETISYTGDGQAPAGDYTPTLGENGMIYISASFFEPAAYAFNGHTGQLVWRQDGFGNWNASVVYAKDIGGGQDVLYAPYAYGWHMEEAPHGYDPGYGMLDPASARLPALRRRQRGDRQRQPLFCLD
jgi:outer membrane protein assembly factor BamB